MNKISDFMRNFQNAIYFYIKKVYKTATKNVDIRILQFYNASEIRASV